MNNMIKIGNHEIAPGTKTILNIPVARIPSGNMISIKTHVFRATEAGPVVLITAGIHGDEINGIEIVRESLADGLFEQLVRGTILVIPVVNVYGFTNFSRDVPDGKDVNRSFPGSTTGSLASRVARIISKRFLPISDIGIDFHTGGASRFNYPQLRISKGSTRAKEIAEVFGAPVILEKGQISKSLRRVAQQDYRVPIVVFEGGESTRLDFNTIRIGKQGIARVLKHYDMIDGSNDHIPALYYKRTSWLRARDPGIFRWKIESGEHIQKDQILGHIFDSNNQQTVVIKSNRDAFLIGHNNAPVVNVGDPLFHLAYD